MPFSSIDGHSISIFVTAYNNDASKQCVLKVNNLSKWVRAERRGEYFDWGKLNYLDARNCKKAENIVSRIDRILKIRDPHHACHNQVCQSPSLEGEYGVIARRFTPAGTFLGFYKGEVINGMEASLRVTSQDYIFSLLIFFQAFIV